MDGKITIDDAYLNLSSIETDGSALGSEGRHITKTFSPADPPIQLTGASGTVKLPIPPGVYEPLALDLVLFPDEYQLLRNGQEEVPSSPEGGNSASDNNGETENPGSPPQNDGQNQEDNGGSDIDQGGHDSDDDAGGPAGDHDDADDGNADNDQGQKDQNGPKGDQHKGKDKHHKGDKHHGGKHDGRITELEAASDIDLADFFQNARPGLLVTATYRNNGKSVKLIFVGDGIERLSVSARQNDSPRIIVTGKGTAYISFDPQQWFSSITPTDIESAAIQKYQGESVLFIHPDFNANLFQAVNPRVQESADWHFAQSAL
jgi:hypothetical protein